MSKFIREKPRTHDGFFVNDQIRHVTIQVIDESGANLGEMPRTKALSLAQAANLDLVMVGEKNSIAVAKIMDFGKFLYEKKKQVAKSKKSQKVIQIKEIKMRPKIGPGDYETKLEQAAEFLTEGKHVKFTLQFRGRQPVSIHEVGRQFFAKLKTDLEGRELGTLVEEKETRAGGIWTKVFHLKEK